MTKRKRNGFVIEMMIVFMLVVFGFGMVILSYLGSLNNGRKYAKVNIDLQTDLNQIGEYYLRYIEESGEQFPVGNETKFTDNKYSWMDDGVKEFFLDCNKKYDFKYEPAFSITRGSLLEFYQTKYVWRKLVVKSSEGDIKMVIELKEQRVSNSETEYFIQKWSVGDSLVDESATNGGYRADDLNLLQKLWKFLGLEIKSLRSWNPTGELRDLLDLFDSTGENWRDAMDNRG